MEIQISPNACFKSVSIQTQADDVTTIQKREEDVTTYKAIADKAKERLDDARNVADQREAVLRKTIKEQRAELRDADNKVYHFKIWQRHKS